MAADRLRTAGHNARTTRTVRTVIAALATMTDSSRAADGYDAIRDTVRRAWSASTEAKGCRGVTAIGRLRRGSRFLAVTAFLTSPLANTVRQAAHRATVVGMARWIETNVRSSWLFRWLTAEPEPEVIVIDLRETVSIGPFIALVDHIARILIPASHRSSAVGIAVSVRQWVTDAPVRALSLVLGVAMLANIAVTIAIGEPTQLGVAVRLVLVGLVGLGTQVSLSWDEFVETRAVKLLVAALEPPDPPEDQRRRE